MPYAADTACQHVSDTAPVKSCRKVYQALLRFAPAEDPAIADNVYIRPRTTGPTLFAARYCPQRPHSFDEAMSEVLVRRSRAYALRERTCHYLRSNRRRPGDDRPSVKLDSYEVFVGNHQGRSTGHEAGRISGGDESILSKGRFDFRKVSSGVCLKWSSCFE